MCSYKDRTLTLQYLTYTGLRICALDGNGSLSDNNGEWPCKWIIQSINKAEEKGRSFQFL